MAIVKNVITGVAVVMISRVLIQKLASQPNQSTPILASETESESFYV